VTSAARGPAAGVPGASPAPIRLQGIIASRGVCRGRAYVYRRRLDVTRTTIPEAQVEREIERLTAAMELTRRDIQAAQLEALQRHGPKYAAIFDSHQLMLDDSQFGPVVARKVKKEHINVESALRETLDALTAVFQAIENEYLRERAIDLKDVGDRVLRHLMGLEGPAKEIGDEPFVLVANELTPTELLDFSHGRLQGICLDSGGATSHVAILAGAYLIPAVFGVGNLSQVARTGDAILIDTRQAGLVVLHPDEAAIAEVAAAADAQAGEGAEERPAGEDRSADGVRLKLGANVARVEELAVLQRRHVNRIGLFRSEFLFMESVDLPGETFQESVYRQVVQAAPEGVVLRTIDIGSDKPVKYLPFPHEENPAMGFRSVRFALSRPDILEPQVRAMIRASAGGKARIIFPMVSVPEELERIERVWQKVLDEVSPPAGSAPEWGIMLEVPSAFFMLDRVARYTRYVSLGTNDLLQFVYGIDRTSERLAALANPLCVAFLRLLFYGVSAAKGEGITVGICGEMAADPAGFAVLLGIGVDEFSMRPAAVSEIRRLVPRLSVRETTRAVNELLTSDGETDIRQGLSQRFPDLADLFGAVVPDAPGEESRPR